MMYKNNFVAVIKCDGKILRERNGGTVYLPYGSEYSVLLKNKDSRRALVEIEVDGENVLNGHKLILNGNTTEEVKGFMRDMSQTNRFKFIHKTREVQRYRGDKIDDGLVRVTYQFEKQEEEPIYIKPTFDWDRDWKKYTRSFAPDNSGGTWNAYYSSNITTSNNLGSYGGTVSCSTPMVTKSCAPRADEGITVKGEKINQNYCYGSMGQLETAIHTIVLQLRGLTGNQKVVSKPVTVKTRIKCSTCGRRNRSTNKFCYNCGTYLN